MPGLRIQKSRKLLQGVAADSEGDYTESGEEEMGSDEDEDDEVAYSGAKEMISESKSLLSLAQVTQSSSSFNTKHGNVLMSKSVNGDKVYQCGVGKESIGFANKVFDGMAQPFSKSKDNVAG
ncbi:hypothetical protein U1Q18_014135 [Sarracenia purpurea var. burkii]